MRVRPAHRDYWRSQPYAEEWLLVEWPQGESAPTKYWLSTLPADTALAMLVETAKLRWRIERDYQELKQELGLDHFEGRGWRGFHHHMALCVATYGFLVSERSSDSPLRRQNPRHQNVWPIQRFLTPRIPRSGTTTPTSVGGSKSEPLPRLTLIFWRHTGRALRLCVCFRLSTLK